MPELVIHVGTHKTGTTSVQRFFSRNRAKLRDAGIWYPSPSVAGLPDHYAHHRIAHAVGGTDAELGFDDAVTFFDTLRSKARDGEKIFLSAEPLYRHVIVDEDSRDSDRYLNFAQRFRQAVGDFDITLMFMFRRQDLFAESLYAEHVMSSGYTHPIEKFLNERAPLFDYSERLGVWSRAFPDAAIAVDLFEPKKFEHPIERKFVEWIGGMWSDEYEQGAARNVTLPRTLVEFKRQINTTGQGTAVNATFRGWLEQLAQMPAAESFPDLGKYYLQPDARLALLDEHVEGNGSIAQRYFDRDELFTESVLDDLRKYGRTPGLNPQEYRKISKLLFRMIASQ